MTTEMIWNQFSKKLLGFIQSKVGRNTDADDLLQEVFLKIHHNLDRLRNLKKVESWIYQITRNVITDYYRKRKNYESLPEEIPSLSGEDRDFQMDISKCIASLTSQLPPKYREPLKGVILDQKSQQVIAAEIGLSLPGAKSRIQRGRQKLKEILKNCCAIESPHQTLDCNCQT